MNKKIFASIFVIGMLAFAMGYGTYSYFSDTEKSTGNVFTAGTINIDVTGNGYTWSAGAKLSDMKPCETGYIMFTITNVGTNPVNVWKKITDVACAQGTQTEPETEEEANVPKFDIDTVILYDLSVFVPIAGNPDGGWWQTIYYENTVISTIKDKSIFLGMIPAGGTMKVTQSYHMKADVTNWAQGDTMTFNIEIYAEQLKGTLRLENKDVAGPTPKTGEWRLILGDGIYGDLTYNMKGPTFDYTFNGYGLTDAIDYSLIYYPDPWPGTGLIVLGSGTPTGGTLTLSGSKNIGDLPAAGDANAPGGAKIWLVLSSDIEGNHMKGWNPGSYLFETCLIKYDDTDVP
jgi:predicted ribosomally synthesized peptide with SipW-like signal peptide